MSNIRRYYVKNAIYFITKVTKNRMTLFASEGNCNLFLQKLRELKLHYPYRLYAFALLPDHFHLLIQPYESNISILMSALLRHFTDSYKKTRNLLRAQLWQVRFWDHMIRDESDFENHFNYIHYNPVKHNLVSKPGDYRYSSFHFWLNKGQYEKGWGHREIPEHLNLSLQYGE